MFGSYRTLLGLIGAKASEIGPAFGLAVTFVALTASWPLARYYDEPVRALLTKMARKHRQMELHQNEIDERPSLTRG